MVIRGGFNSGSFDRDSVIPSMTCREALTLGTCCCGFIDPLVFLRRAEMRNESILQVMVSDLSINNAISDATRSLSNNGPACHRVLVETSASSILESALTSVRLATFCTAMQPLRGR
jgi:hypothetical protein